MLQFNPIIPNDIKALPQVIISDFKKSLQAMLNSSLKNPNDEEFQKNCIKDFLRDSFEYSCNTRGKVDLAIYDDEIPKVLFEVKSLSNKAEFVKSPDLSLRGSGDSHNEAIHTKEMDCRESATADSRNDKWNLSSKALYESILYYLREWHKHKNNNIKHIILCTAKEFYILKAADYHRLFAKNKDIERAYNNCDFNEGNDTSTARFYKQVESIIEAMEGEIEFCYINVQSTLNNQNDLALLYTLLSPNFLLQIPRYIDANTLNERFYKELLYILGLVQVEQNKKELIHPSTTPNTLLHSIKRDFADKLPQDLGESSESNALDSRQNPSHPQDSHDSTDIFDSHIFPLIMLWNNRILFLRLLESMLLSFRHITKPFLDISILGDFGALNTLFFKVLAVKNRSDIPQNLAEIPYLNSSLFEKSTLESQGFEIATLESRPLKIAPDSILRRDKDLRQRYKDECLPLLEYLFAFLHAYDFTTTPSDIANNAKTNHDKLINSAVLGLVFEKLNGYKEGSFYTPSFITRYMCENSLRKIVLEKFNQTNPQWQCKTIADIEYEIHREIRQARNVQNSSSQGQRQNRSISSLRGSGDSHNEAIQSYRHSEGAKRPKNPRIKGEFLDSSLRTSCYAQNDEAIIDCHESATADSRNDGFVGDYCNDSTKEILAKYNKIFLSIRICDPAVGSGHFLVSALNELIALKSELGLLLDCDGVRLSDIDLVLENDELLIKDSKGKMLDYTIPAHERVESHKIQKALFYTKKELIENCLFGVDINPNSVEICKLRLWIELLKYSYYENIATKELQTLPNIDINIKCGNSLISLFELNETDEVGNPKPHTLKWLKNQNDEFAKNFGEKLLRYNHLVQTYKEKLGDKQAITKEIESIKSYFKNTLLDNSFVSKQMREKLRNFVEIYGDMTFDIETPFGMDMIKIIRHNRMKFMPIMRTNKDNVLEYSTPKEIDKQGQKLLDSIRADFDNIQSIKEKQTFEWRFEFPEVLDLQSLQSKQEKAKLHNAQKRAGQNPKPNELDSIGDFMGFDLIIGNPPYIDYRAIDSRTKDFLSKNSMIYGISKEGSIYMYFIERAKDIVSQSGNIIFINPIAYICQDSGKGLREFIDKNLTLLQMVNVSNVKVFDSASAYTCVNYFAHKNNKCKEIMFGEADKKDLSDIKLRKIKQTKIENISTLLDSITTKIFEAKYPQLNEFCDIFCGLSKTGFRQGVSTRKTTENRAFLEASDILRYEFKQVKFLNQISTYYSQDKIKIFEKGEIIFMARMTNFIRCCIAPNGYFGGKVNILHNFKINKRYILGILNSKLMSYFYAKKYFASHMQGGAFGFDTLSVGSLPIPKLTTKNQKIADKIVNLVDKILESKAQGKDSNESESQIDDLVYQLYDLDSHEIAIIESK